MRKLLIVSPHFPPVNAPDLHRVRMSLPYYRSFGWDPIVLAVRAEDQDEPRDESLLETLPPDVPVVRVGAFPAAVCKKAGIGNVALRGLSQLYRGGSRIIRDRGIDLVFFSTTMFFSMPLGRLWRHRRGVPYVLDIQDPWYATYDDTPRRHVTKRRAANALHARLEQWTMRRAAGVMAVSPAYVDALAARYSWLHDDMFDVIPFGAAPEDVDRAGRRPVRSPSDRPTGVYVGRGGDDMSTAARILFRGVTHGSPSPPCSPGVRFRFIGTDYATDGRARQTIAPIAAESGFSDVEEISARQPYLDALAELVHADFLVLLGSDDPAYSASKVYPYILAKRPLLAIVHERSPLVDVLRRTRAGLVVTFAGRGDVDAPASRLCSEWPSFRHRMGSVPDTDWEAFRDFTAERLTERQCRFFDRVAPRP